MTENITRSKKYYLAHKDKILEKCKMKQYCKTCDMDISVTNFNRHEKGIPHLLKKQILSLTEENRGLSHKVEVFKYHNEKLQNKIKIYSDSVFSSLLPKVRNCNTD